MSYYADFDAAGDGDSYYLKVFLKSPVAQHAHVTAYTYKDPVAGHSPYTGVCYESYGSSDGSWLSVGYDGEAKVGTSFAHWETDLERTSWNNEEYLYVNGKWAEKDLRPHDFTIVVWADEEPVPMVDYMSNLSESFPNFELKEDMQVFDLDGNPVSLSLIGSPEPTTKKARKTDNSNHGTFYGSLAAAGAAGALCLAYMAKRKSTINDDYQRF